MNLFNPDPSDPLDGATPGDRQHYEALERRGENPRRCGTCHFWQAIFPIPPRGRCLAVNGRESLAYAVPLRVPEPGKPLEMVPKDDPTCAAWFVTSEEFSCASWQIATVERDGHVIEGKLPPDYPPPPEAEEE